MSSVDAILAELKSKGNPNTLKIYARHGMAGAEMYGVSVADMKTIAKGIEGQQELALQLYDTKVMEAMYLAGLVANGANMPKATLNAWAESADGIQMIAEYSVPWVTVESPYARELAVEWMASPKPNIAATGWRTYSGWITVTPDDKLDLKEIEGLVGKIGQEIHKAENRVKLTMNSFLIAVGSYVAPLNALAKITADSIGVVTADMGETACKVPSARAYIEKVEASGKAGVKKKTIRC